MERASWSGRKEKTGDIVTRTDRGGGNVVGDRVKTSRQERKWIQIDYLEGVHDILSMYVFIILVLNKCVGCRVALISVISHADTYIDSLKHSRISSIFCATLQGCFTRTHNHTPKIHTTTQHTLFGTYTVLVMGNNGVGKTSLLCQFMTSEDMGNRETSLGKY